MESDVTTTADAENADNCVSKGSKGPCEIESPRSDINTISVINDCDQTEGYDCETENDSSNKKPELILEPNDVVLLGQKESVVDNEVMFNPIESAVKNNVLLLKPIESGVDTDALMSQPIEKNLLKDVSDKFCLEIKETRGGEALNIDGQNLGLNGANYKIIDNPDEENPNSEENIGVNSKNNNIGNKENISEIISGEQVSVEDSVRTFKGIESKEIYPKKRISLELDKREDQTKNIKQICATEDLNLLETPHHKEDKFVGCLESKVQMGISDLESNETANLNNLPLLKTDDTYPKNSPAKKLLIEPCKESLECKEIGAKEQGIVLELDNFVNEADNVGKASSAKELSLQHQDSVENKIVSCAKSLGNMENTNPVNELSLNSAESNASAANSIKNEKDSILGKEVDCMDKYFSPEYHNKSNDVESDPEKIESKDNGKSKEDLENLSPKQSEISQNQKLEKKYSNNFTSNSKQDENDTLQSDMEELWASTYSEDNPDCVAEEKDNCNYKLETGSEGNSNSNEKVNLNDENRKKESKTTITDFEETLDEAEDKVGNKEILPHPEEDQERVLYDVGESSELISDEYGEDFEGFEKDKEKKFSIKFSESFTGKESIKSAAIVQKESENVNSKDSCGTVIAKLEEKILKLNAGLDEQCESPSSNQDIVVFDMQTEEDSGEFAFPEAEKDNVNLKLKKKKSSEIDHLEIEVDNINAKLDQGSKDKYHHKAELQSNESDKSEMECEDFEGSVDFSKFFINLKDVDAQKCTSKEDVCSNFDEIEDDQESLNSKPEINKLSLRSKTSKNPELFLTQTDVVDSSFSKLEDIISDESDIEKLTLSKVEDINSDESETEKLALLKVEDINSDESDSGSLTLLKVEDINSEESEAENNMALPKVEDINSEESYAENLSQHSSKEIKVAKSRAKIASKVGPNSADDSCQDENRKTDTSHLEEKAVGDDIAVDEKSKPEEDENFCDLANFEIVDETHDDPVCENKDLPGKGDETELPKKSKITMITFDDLPKSTKKLIQVPLKEIRGQDLKGTLFTRVVIVGNSFIKELSKFWPLESTLKPFFIIDHSFSFDGIYEKIHDHPFLIEENNVLVVILPGTEPILKFKAFENCYKKHLLFKVPHVMLANSEKLCSEIVNEMSTLKNKLESNDKIASVVYGYIPYINLPDEANRAVKYARNYYHHCNCYIKLMKMNREIDEFENMRKIVNQNIFSNNLTEIPGTGFLEFAPYLARWFNKGCWMEHTDGLVSDGNELSQKLSDLLFKPDIEKPLRMYLFTKFGEYRNKLHGKYNVFVIGDSWLKGILEVLSPQDEMKPFFYFNTKDKLSELKKLILYLTRYDEDTLIITSAGLSNFVTFEKFADCDGHEPLTYPVPKRNMYENPLGFAASLCSNIDEVLKEIRHCRRHCKVVFMTCYPLMFDVYYQYLTEEHMRKTKHGMLGKLNDIIGCSNFLPGVRQCLKDINNHFVKINMNNGLHTCDIFSLLSHLIKRSKFVFPVYIPGVSPPQLIQEKLSLQISQYILSINILFGKKKFTFTTRPTFDSIKMEEENFLFEKGERIDHISDSKNLQESEVGPFRRDNNSLGNMEERSRGLRVMEIQSTKKGDISERRVKMHAEKQITNKGDRKSRSVKDKQDSSVNRILEGKEKIKLVNDRRQNQNKRQDIADKKNQGQHSQSHEKILDLKPLSERLGRPGHSSSKEHVEKEDNFVGQTITDFARQILSKETEEVRYPNEIISDKKYQPSKNYEARYPKEARYPMSPVNEVRYPNQEISESQYSRLSPEIASQRSPIRYSRSPFGRTRYRSKSRSPAKRFRSPERYSKRARSRSRPRLSNRSRSPRRRNIRQRSISAIRTFGADYSGIRARSREGAKLSRKRSRSMSPPSSFKRGRTNSTKEEALKNLWDIHSRECEKYRNNPEAHPDYYRSQRMWMQVSKIEHRSGHNSLPFIGPWREYWIKKMETIFKDSWEDKKAQCLSLLPAGMAHSRSRSRLRSRLRSRSRSRLRSRLRSHLRSRSRLRSRPRSRSRSLAHSRTPSSSSISSSDSERNLSLKKDKHKHKKKKSKSKKSKSKKRGRRDSSAENGHKPSRVADLYSQDTNILSIEDLETRINNFMEKAKCSSKYASKSYDNKRHSIHNEEHEVTSSTVTESQKLEVKLMDVTTVLSQISGRLGALGMSLSVLHTKVVENFKAGKDPLKYIDDDAKMLLNLINDKLSRILEDKSLTLVQRAIIQEAHDRLTPFLETFERTQENSLHFGLDINIIANATLGKDVPDIIGFIQNALAYKQVFNASNDDLMNIYLEVKNVQMKLIAKKPATDSSVDPVYASTSQQYNYPTAASSSDVQQFSPSYSGVVAPSLFPVGAASSSSNYFSKSQRSIASYGLTSDRTGAMSKSAQIQKDFMSLPMHEKLKKFAEFNSLPFEEKSFLLAHLEELERNDKNLAQTLRWMITQKPKT